MNKYTCVKDLYLDSISMIFLFTFWHCSNSVIFFLFIILLLKVLHAIPYDIVCQWPSTGGWFSQRSPVSCTNKTNRHDITEILLNLTLHLMNLNHMIFSGIVVEWNIHPASNQLVLVVEEIGFYMHGLTMLLV